MKWIKLYITPESIKERLAEKTNDTSVIFTKAEIGIDGCLEFTCLVVEDEFENKLESTRRERY